MPATAPPANPWAGLDAMAGPAPAPAAPAPPPAPAAPQPLEVEVAPDDEDRPRKPPRAGRTRPAPAEGGGVPTWVVVLLGVYALIATGLAVYGLLFNTGEPPDGHPLSTIPDTFGEFEPASRKKVAQLRFNVEGQLPADQKAALGGKIEIGQLEIQPVHVEKRRLVLFAEGKAEKRRLGETGEALVLKLKVKNTSTDLTIYPLDPAFNRRSIGDDKAATRLVVGKQTFAGGPVSWPFSRNVAREYERDQEGDAIPLRPGETREYSVCSAADPRLLAAVRTSKDPVVWRVQVRRGLIEFKGRDVPVTAIVGVEFRPSEVKTTD
jgi:hypothetical protein